MQELAKNMGMNDGYESKTADTRKELEKNLPL